MKKALVAFIIFLGIAISAQGQSLRDVLYTADGEETRGELIEITPVQVLFQTPQGMLRLNRNEVLSVEFGKERAGDTWRTIDDIDDELLLDVLGKIPEPEVSAGANYIVLYDSRHIEFRLDGTIETSHRRISQVLAEGAKDYVALNEIYFFPDIESPEIVHARSISPSGQVLHLDESAIERGSINPYFPDYDRLNILKYALGEMAVGSVVDVSEKTIRRGTSPLDPFFLSVQFYSDAPAMRREVYLICETGTNPAFDVANWPKNWPSAKIETTPAFTKYSWIIENIPPVLPESNMPPEALYSPTLLISDGISWDSIAVEFDMAIRTADDSPPRIDRVLERILAGRKSQKDKARAIYTWISTEVGFIPVDAYIYGFTPKKLSQIVGKQSANDLDRAFLFYCLAKRSGIEVSIGFASAHEDGFSETVPSLFSVPVPIVLATLDGQRIIIDLSTDFLPMGTVETSIMGEPAVFFSNGKYQISSIPMPFPAEEGKSAEMTIRLSPDGSIQGQLHEKYFGNRQENIRDFRYVTQEQIRQAMEERVGKIHNSAHLDGWRLQNISDLDAIPELIVEFSAPDYAIDAGGKFLAFKLPGIDYSAWGTGATTRKWPVWFDSPHREKNKIDIELPSGYRLYHLPENVRFEADSISYTAVFTEKKGHLIFDDDYSRSRMAFAPEKYPEYREYRRAQAAVANRWVVLEKAK